LVRSRDQCPPYFVGITHSLKIEYLF
jgi:hypothetical protein